ncbi:hypothetical protein ACFY5A_15895 [Microbacterium sp. NPDC012755]|uniref:hypothetical protein n=1 Tax=Microbacterium sp. NPDC012755 TaxID=3364184 RepID=UPI0036CBD19B
MGRLRMWVDRVSGRESRALRQRLLEAEAEARRLRTECDSVLERLEALTPTPESPAVAPPASAISSTHSVVRDLFRDPGFWVRIAVSVTIVVVLAFLAAPAFPTLPTSSVDFEPAPDPSSFRVLVETPSGAQVPRLVVSREARWSSLNMFTVQFDDMDERAPWPDVAVASRVLLAAPSSLTDWLCAPMETWDAADKTVKTTMTNWELAQLVTTGNLISSTDLSQLNDVYLEGAPSMRTVDWNSSEVRRPVGRSEYLNNQPGTAYLAGVTCVEVKHHTTLDVDELSNDWQGWMKNHAARVDPSLDEGSLRRVRLVGVKATTSEKTVSRQELSFTFPVSWSLSNGSLGSLSLDSTRISGCATNEMCPAAFDDAPHSWVFTDTVAQVKASQSQQSGALFLSVGLGFVLSELIAYINFIRSLRLRPGAAVADPMERSTAHV